MLTVEELEQRLHGLPRFPLGVGPTPLHHAPGLAERLGLRDLLIKRDDLTGLAFGGNKVRVLEFVIGHARAQGCDVLIAGGGRPQSNHARLCAAAARKAGMRCVLVLRGSGSESVTGNLLLTKMLGAHIEWRNADPELAERGALASAMQVIAEEESSCKHRPYVLQSSVHPRGVLGYVRGGLELLRQLDGQRPAIFAASEGSVVAGLVLMARLVGADWRVTGVRWRPPQPGTETMLARLCAQACELLDIESPVRPAHFIITGDGGPGYGLPSSFDSEVMRMCLDCEALFVDPVYTAKGMAGLARAAAAGAIEPDRVPVFVHTGGLPVLFADSSRSREAAARVGEPPTRESRAIPQPS